MNENGRHSSRDGNKNYELSSTLPLRGPLSRWSPIQNLWWSTGRSPGCCTYSFWTVDKRMNNHEYMLTYSKRGLQGYTIYSKNNQRVSTKAFNISRWIKLISMESTLVQLPASCLNQATDFFFMADMTLIIRRTLNNIRSRKIYIFAVKWQSKNWTLDPY